MNPGASPGEALQGLMNIRAQSLPDLALCSGALLELRLGEQLIPKQFTADAWLHNVTRVCVRVCVYLYTHTSPC